MSHLIKDNDWCRKYWKFDMQPGQVSSEYLTHLQQEHYLSECSTVFVLESDISTRIIPISNFFSFCSMMNMNLSFCFSGMFNLPVSSKVNWFLHSLAFLPFIFYHTLSPSLIILYFKLSFNHCNLIVAINMKQPRKIFINLYLYL